MNKIVRTGQLWHLTVAFFREIIREPGVLFWGIIFPILMSLGLGLAFTRKGDVIRKVAVITNEQTLQNGTIYNFLTERCEKGNSPDGPVRALSRDA
jgi:hypothetical protein